MKKTVSILKNDKAFCLLISIHEPDMEPKRYIYPSLNMELLLAKVEFHIKDYITEIELKNILHDLTEFNCDMKVEEQIFTIYVGELSAKELYKPKIVPLLSMEIKTNVN